jgi:3-phenylpropionate/trans-cinnamate dioxygenase ferredoxin subunit
MPITIKVRDNGPYVISNDDAQQVIITDAAGNVLTPLNPKPGKGIALCRCGASVTKPFCDGTHTRIGFQAAEAAVRHEHDGG